jgi:lipopolysaccharide/colanic/teichoic acid biosynthesis glycosyltransferase
MARRLIDLLVAAIVLVVASPLIALVTLGIRLTSPGPVIYRARRIGRSGRPFTMLKFRTMHHRPDSERSAITASHDARVFPLGSLLRRTKLDELPQFLNVLRGEMSIVGPRPEDPGIVSSAYRPEHLETLGVRPGLASPGSLFNYTHAESMLDGVSTESVYVERLLPLKLALETVYVRHASVLYDLSVMFRTAGVILAIAAGKRRFRDPPEMAAAIEVLGEWHAIPTPLAGAGQGGG